MDAVPGADVHPRGTDADDLQIARRRRGGAFVVDPALPHRERIHAFLASLLGLEPLELQELRGPFKLVGGLRWQQRLAALKGCADGPEGERSTLILFEDGVPLGPSHASHDDIASRGGGCWSHWEEHVMFSTSDGTDPGRNGRAYCVVRLGWDLELELGAERSLLGPFTPEGGHRFKAVVPESAKLSDAGLARFSPLRVYEDGRELGPAHVFHERIATRGQGCYSHWGNALYFSSSDGSDPNTNGRRYTIGIGQRDAGPEERAKSEYLERFYRKRQIYLAEPTELWRVHAEGEWFLQRGGRAAPPPIYCNMIGLTSFCNLRCTICGSQEAIDHEGVPRRSMDLEIMRSVADTIFPFVSVVILASLGEPTIYPHFNEVLEKVNEHGCSIKLESNATALTPRMIDLLCSVRGELFFSIDATRDIFEVVRKNAKWEKVDKNVRALVAQRDPELTKVNIYPTISRRTLPDMIRVVEWAADVGVQEMTFHSYDPTMFAQEERPTDAEFELEIDRIREWIEKHVGAADATSLSIKVNGQEVNPRYVSEATDCYSLVGLPRNNPISADRYDDHPFICTVPQQHVEIGPDGQIYPCVWSGARPQDNTMGFATSKEAFAETWFGQRYCELRESLRVGSTVPKNVAQCDACIQRYA